MTCRASGRRVRRCATLLLVAPGVVSACVGPPTLAVVETVSGPIAGFVTAQGRAFFDIPYAAPPLGPRRWREPEPMPPWTGLRTMHFQRPASSAEDCLRLDVFTPPPHRGPPLPMLVWLATPGDERDARLDGTSLAGTGLVVAVVRSRPGLFGAFAHAALDRQRPDGPCNFGMLDQVAALQWLRQHAERFHADPERLVLAGSRRGATAVLFLLASEAARGLCSAAILQDPEVFAVPTPRRRALLECERLLVQHELLPAVTAHDVRALPAERLLAISPPGRDLALPNADGALVQSAPYELWERGAVPPVPLLVGSSGADGDLDGAAAARWLALRHSARAPVFLYRFGYAPERAALACDPTPLLWRPRPRRFGPDAEAQDRRVAEILRDYWTSFARDGLPRSNAAPPWPPSAAGSDATQIIDDTVVTVPGWRAAELDRASAVLRTAATATTGGG